MMNDFVSKEDFSLFTSGSHFSRTLALRKRQRATENINHFSLENLKSTLVSDFRIPQTTNNGKIRLLLMVKSDAR